MSANVPGVMLRCFACGAYKRAGEFARRASSPHRLCRQGRCRECFRSYREQRKEARR